MSRLASMAAAAMPVVILGSALLAVSAAASAAEPAVVVAESRGQGSAASTGIGAKAAPRIGEGEAKQIFERHGYSEITNLKQDKSDWTAKAKKNGEPAAVRLRVTSPDQIDCCKY